MHRSLIAGKIDISSRPSGSNGRLGGQAAAPFFSGERRSLSPPRPNCKMERKLSRFLLHSQPAKFGTRSTPEKLAARRRNERYALEKCSKDINGSSWAKPEGFGIERQTGMGRGFEGARLVRSRAACLRGWTIIHACVYGKFGAEVRSGCANWHD